MMQPRHPVDRSVASLSIALVTSAIASSVARSQETVPVRKSFESLHIRATQEAKRGRTQPIAIGEIERQLDNLIRATCCGDITSDCDEKPVVYIEGIGGELPTSVLFHIAATGGDHFCYFTSGTSLMDVAGSLSYYGFNLAINASIAQENPSRVAIRSTQTGMSAFVMAEQLTGTDPVVTGSPVGGQLQFSLTDYGCAVSLPICAEFGKIYFETHSILHSEVPVVVEIYGHFGSAILTVQPGTSQEDIIAQINAVSHLTGTIAAVSSVNPARIEIRSQFAGYYGSILYAMQYSGVPFRLSNEPVGGYMWYYAYDHGPGPVAGDANCDRTVSVADLISVIQNWGPCPSQPFVCFGDVSGDGIVNVGDLLRVINHWGEGDP